MKSMGGAGGLGEPSSADINDDDDDDFEFSISFLPNELLTAILMHCRPHDLAILSRVSLRFNALAERLYMHPFISRTCSLRPRLVLGGRRGVVSLFC